MANVAMKVYQTSGINHSVSKPHPILKGTLLLGADATHPGGTSNPSTPSVAAVVGSLDAKCVRFYGSMRLQKRENLEGTKLLNWS